MVSERSFLGSTMADPIYELKKLEQTGGIKEYYEAFNRIQGNINLPEEFLISWFVAGLKADTRKEVQSIQPETLIQAYAYGRMYEIAYPKGRPLVTKKSSLLISQVSLPASPTQDTDHVPQPELQNSDEKFCETLQDSYFSHDEMPQSIANKKGFSINKREETLVMNGFPRIEPDQELVLEMGRQQHIAFRQKNTQQSSEKMQKGSVAHNVFDEMSNMDTRSNNFGDSSNSEVEANCTIKASGGSKSQDRNILGKPPEASDRESDGLCLYATIVPIDIEDAYQMFDEISRYGLMINNDVLSDGELKNDDIVIIDEDPVQTETKLGPILVKEPSDLDAYHLFEEMPKSISSHEIESLRQVAKLNDESIATGLESQMFSRNSVEQNDVSRDFGKQRRHSSTIIPMEEQQIFKVHEVTELIAATVLLLVQTEVISVFELLNGILEQQKKINGYVGIVGFDPGGVEFASILWEFVWRNVNSWLASKGYVTITLLEDIAAIVGVVLELLKFPDMTGVLNCLLETACAKYWNGIVWHAYVFKFPEQLLFAWEEFNRESPFGGHNWSGYGRFFNFSLHELGENSVMEDAFVRFDKVKDSVVIFDPGLIIKEKWNSETRIASLVCESVADVFLSAIAQKDVYFEEHIFVGNSRMKKIKTIRLVFDPGIVLKSDNGLNQVPLWCSIDLSCGGSILEVILGMGGYTNGL